MAETMIGEGPVLLSDIIRDLCVRCDLPVDEASIAAVVGPDVEIEGYVLAQPLPYPEPRTAVVDTTIPEHVANEAHGSRYGIDWIWHDDRLGYLLTKPVARIDRLTNPT